MNNQSLQTIISNLIENDKPIELDKLFREIGVFNKQHGEPLFKKVVELLIKNRKGKVQAWAKRIKGDGYKELYTETMDKFWTQLQIQRASNARLERFYSDETQQLDTENKAETSINIGHGKETEEAQLPPTSQQQQPSLPPTPNPVYKPQRPDDDERGLSVDSNEEQGEQAEDSEYDEQDDKQIPSDITVEYHEQRTRQLYLDNVPKEEPPTDEGVWMVIDQNISQKCYEIKALSIGLQRKAMNMGDLRLLALNDIYLISNNDDNSITKYFARSLRDAVLASVDFNVHLPTPPQESQYWCFDVAQKRPTDLVAAVSYAHECMGAALATRNQVDLHVAIALTQYLPIFYARSPPSDIEDSYVHHYLAPIIQSVFASNSQSKVNWANVQLLNDTCKPDLLVSSNCGSLPLALVIGEFKPPNHNSSQMESDQIKLGKQMRVMINALVSKGIPDPVVCGIMVQEFDMSFFIMDLPSPKLYRLLNLATLTMFKTLDQIATLPHITSRLVQLANIASNTVERAESAILIDRTPSRSQRDWISQAKCTLARR